MSFVFLHGIEQQDKTSNDLRLLWIDSIRVGLDRAQSKNPVPRREQVVMPYYGDLLTRLPATAHRNMSRDIGSEASSPDTKESVSGDWSATIEEWRSEISRVKLPDSSLHSGVGGQQTRGFKSNALGAMSSVLPLLMQNQIVDRVLIQVSAYLNDTQIKKNILALGASALSEAASLAEARSEPLIVAAHSLGTVVALEALADFKEREVDLLITIGSPLSTETVASRMNQNARRWPLIVRNWVNVSDADDIVALHHSIDRRNFLRNCADRDSAAVFNIGDVVNHMDNHHGIAGYLDDPVVAQTLTSMSYAP